MALTIGDFTRNGLYQIVDTTHPSSFGGGSNDLRVTVRELYGIRDVSPRDIRAMRDLAKRAVDNARSSHEVGRFFDGSTHITFIVRGAHTRKVPRTQ